MKTLIIVAHPNLQSSRVNRTLADTIRKRPDTTVHALYETYPDHVIDVAQEQSLLDRHERRRK